MVTSWIFVSTLGVAMEFGPYADLESCERVRAAVIKTFVVQTVFVDRKVTPCLAVQYTRAAK